MLHVEWQFPGWVKQLSLAETEHCSWKNGFSFSEQFHAKEIYKLH